MTSSLSAIILDSNKSSRKTLLSVVRQGLGIKAANEFEQAKQAISYLQANRNTDLMFIDYDSVSDKTFELVSLSKKLKGSDNLKFVLLANSANKEFLLDAARKGISTFILKPYNSKTVVQKVKKICGSSKNRESHRLSLLEAVSVQLIANQQEVAGALVDISSGGCLVKTSRLGPIGVDIYDELMIRIPFDNETIDVPAELIRTERDLSSDAKKISAAFTYKKMEQNVALQFAKLWAALLRDNDNG